MIYVTRRERFSSAHKLYQPLWSKEQNEAIFGKCANENWHGHNFELFVTVKGEVNKETGFVADLKDLSKVINEHAVDLLDHRNINMDVDFMAGKMASTENLAMGIWDQLATPIAALGCTLHCIRLCETENNSVEYFGES